MSIDLFKKLKEVIFHISTNNFCTLNKNHNPLVQSKIQGFSQHFIHNFKNNKHIVTIFSTCFIFWKFVMTSFQQHWTRRYVVWNIAKWRYNMSGRITVLFRYFWCLLLSDLLSFRSVTAGWILGGFAASFSAKWRRSGTSGHIWHKAEYKFRWYLRCC